MISRTILFAAALTLLGACSSGDKRADSTALGADTDQLLGELGYPSEHIDALRARRVIA